MTLLFLLACEAGMPAESSDASGDTAGESGEATAPVVTILAPTSSETVYLGARYDVVATVEEGETATATITGAESSCESFSAGVLHCSVIASAAGLVDIAVVAEGAGGSTTASVSATARAAVGIIPEGEQFAMGTYELQNEHWIPDVASGGFNLGQSYGTGAYTQTEWQDWMASAGLWTMTRPSWSWSDPWGDLSDGDTLTALAARPEIAWWELPETPVEDASYTDEVQSVVELIRTYDDRPTQMYFWTSSLPEDIAEYVPMVNVISPGAYPEHACQVQPWIRYRIETAREAVALAGYTELERPVVGTSDLYARPENSCPELVAQLPQVRMNPLAMMAAGARGIIYFAWWYAALELDPAWAESAKDTAELITGESGLGLAVVHGTSLGTLPVTVTSGPELSAAFTPAHLTTELQFPSIHAAAWDYAGTRFVIAVNYTNEAVSADISGFPAATTGVEAVGEDRTVPSSAGAVSEQFEGWGAHVYRAPIILP